MEAEQKKKIATHGGARAGAGRKRTNHGKYYGFNSTPEVEQILENYNGSKTEMINNAIIYFARSKHD